MNRPADPRRMYVLGCVLFAALAPTPTVAQPADRYHWKQVGEESGCQLVTSVVAGKRYLASKASCLINARLHDIGAVLRDISHYSGWMHDCTTTTMLRVVDPANDTYVFWYRQHIPIFADRDVVLRSEVSHGKKEDGRDWYSIVAASTGEAVHDAGKGYVRMPSFVSEWRLEEVDQEHTRVSFMIDPDLGEGLPIGLTNALITQMPLKSIRGLTQVLEQHRQVFSSTLP